MQPASTCPDRAALEQLLLGRAGPHTETLQRHVAGCRACQAVLQSLPGGGATHEFVRAAPPPYEATQADAPGQPPPPGEATAFQEAAPRRETLAFGSAAAAESYDFLAPAAEPGELGRLGPYRVLGVL